jgi:hypothetical protein
MENGERGNPGMSQKIEYFSETDWQSDRSMSLGTITRFRRSTWVRSNH